jgi:hypothetical protein
MKINYLIHIIIKSLAPPIYFSKKYSKFTFEKCKTKNTILTPPFLNVDLTILTPPFLNVDLTILAPPFLKVDLVPKYIFVS